MLSSQELPDKGKLPIVLIEDEETIALIHSEDDSKYGTFEESGAFQQGLQKRHMLMIGLAGGVGSGLLLNIGGAVVAGGPVGALLAYIVVGLATCGVVLTIGEMGALIPLNGAIVRYTEFLVDPALSFTIGWNQVYSCLMSAPAEVTAATILVQFWIVVNDAIWITLFVFIVLATALLFVRVFGEIEYMTSVLKIVLVVFFNIMALAIACGANTDHEVTGFKYWSKPGPFVQYLGVPGAAGRFMGVWVAARNALFAYSGLDGIAVTAAEMQNPRKEIPSAAKRNFLKVGFFFILTLFMITLVIPSDDPNLLRSGGSVSQSPFVIAAHRAGLQAVPTLINTVALTTSWSSANNSLLRGSRYLYGLATTGNAPQIFTRVSRFGVPYIAVGLHGIFICVSYFTMSSSVSACFAWLQSLISIAALINWIVTCITYLRLYYGCKAQGIDRKDLPWAAPFQPYGTWLTLLFLSLLLLAGDPSVFVSKKLVLSDFAPPYINVAVILSIYLARKFWRQTRIVPLSDLPIRPFIEMANSDSTFKPR